MNLNPALPGRLTRLDEGNVGGPRVSGDGSTVAWTRWFGKDWEVMRHRDGQTQRITKDPGQDGEVDLSHDGRTLVYSRTVGEDPFDPSYHQDVVLWRDGQETLVAGTEADEFEPRVSADGRSVVYVRDHIREKTGYDIHRWQDGRSSPVTSGPDLDRRPFLGGERVFFTRTFRRSDLWMRDEAGKLKPLTSREGGEYEPAASGDGRVVAWSQKDNEKDHFLYVYDTEGGNPVRLVAQPGVDATGPSLDASGSTVAFTRRDKAQGLTQVCLASEGQVQPLNLDGTCFAPHVSADGRTVTFLAVEGRQVAVYRFDRE